MEPGPTYDPDAAPHAAPDAAPDAGLGTGPDDAHLSALLVVVVTAAVIALPYWASGDARVHDDGILGVFGLVAAALFAGSVAACSMTRAWTVPLAMLACVPVAVLGRVLLDTAADPTSHNLWPFEVALGIALSIPPIGAGALVAWLIRRRRAAR